MAPENRDTWEKPRSMADVETWEKKHPLIENQFEAIQEAWEKQIIPPEPDGFDDMVEYGESQYPGIVAYLQKLREALVSAAKEANNQEQISQHLAEANVRQTKLVQQLRTQVEAFRAALVKQQGKNR
jgi:hypothetical protein